MGAKQSKRSVDISGKEAEGGGEVAAAGAGGEGRMEQIQDVDLKPQLNGAAHIQHEPSDKEKELDSGTPENEKDATTEKENKEESDKEAAPVTNGDSEEKIENGETTPTPEDGKKPKKEKVKKKWSLRSISFSRKDKPKQEKKQKDEEPKTNGEPEKVPEETAETAPESATNEVAEEAKAPETKEETTPETPVTEPLTNGTSTPESKADTPATEEPVSPERPEPTPIEPEHLPINGLSLDEPKLESQVEKSDETKPEPPAADIVETAPAPEIPVKEVCVEQMPLLEPTPPPLPANPPPSSVASFAATTMAPELTDASLVNNSDTAIAPLSALPLSNEVAVDIVTLTSVVKNDVANGLSHSLKGTAEETKEEIAPSVAESNDSKSDSNEGSATPVVIEVAEPQSEPEIIPVTSVEQTEPIEMISSVDDVVEPTLVEPVVPVAALDEEIGEPVKESEEKILSEVSNVIESEPKVEEVSVIPLPVEVKTEVKSEEIVVPPPSDVVEPEPHSDEVLPPPTDVIESEPTSEESLPPPPAVDESEAISDEVVPPAPDVDECKPDSEIVDLPLPEDVSLANGDLPLPPPPIQDDVDTGAGDSQEIVENNVVAAPEIPAPTTDMADSNHTQETKDANDSIPEENKVVCDENAKNKIRTESEKVIEKIECNGDGIECGVNGTESRNGPTRNGSAEACSARAELAAPPQELLPVADKLSDLIPEVPDVPELKTEALQETVSDVAVAN